jgi:hypothetical protein
MRKLAEYDRAVHLLVDLEQMAEPADFDRRMAELRPRTHASRALWTASCAALR